MNEGSGLRLQPLSLTSKFTVAILGGFMCFLLGLGAEHPKGPLGCKERSSLVDPALPEVSPSSRPPKPFTPG
jgi:hypothetical protein